jgi:alkanesulfonate monooxygenase SsuD/methylene tetrahydromethanopterin reductase-like flavin-dependent oxidoreductase (luciferase family)
VRVNPKPARDGRLPIVLGGNSDAALRRVAEWGDGWYGFNVDGVEAVSERIATLRSMCDELGRDPDELHLAVALREPHRPDVAALVELGVDEFVVVAGPPDDPGTAAEWVADLAAEWSPETLLT